MVLSKYTIFKLSNLLFIRGYDENIILPHFQHPVANHQIEKFLFRILGLSAAFSGLNQPPRYHLLMAPNETQHISSIFKLRVLYDRVLTITNQFTANSRQTALHLIPYPRADVIELSEGNHLRNIAGIIGYRTYSFTKS